MGTANESGLGLVSAGLGDAGEEAGEGGPELTGELETDDNGRDEPEEQHVERYPCGRPDQVAECVTPLVAAVRISSGW
jgi:hypothetical protein